jgi:hypothetical protein
MCKKLVATHNFLPCCGANGDGDDAMKEEIQSDIMTGRTCTSSGNQASHRQRRTKYPGHQRSSMPNTDYARPKTQDIGVAACLTQTTQE